MDDKMAGEPRAPSATEIAVSEALGIIGGAVEELLEDAAGKRYGFALFVFPFNELGNGSYATNAEPKAMAETVRQCLARIEAKKPTPAVHTLREQN